MRVPRDQRKTLIDRALASRIAQALSGLRPAEIILFGSRARGDAQRDSDVDLIVVLDQPGTARSYGEVVRRRMLVNRLLRDIRSEMPVDVLVYTRDEWAALQASGSSFVREIQETGLRIL